MKVIDLLNKIANGEAPKNIRYNDTDYYLFDRKSYLTTDKSRFFDSIYFKELNDEVEVIEEDKKIEYWDYDKDCTNEWNFQEIKEKLDEIIDVLNKE